MKKYTFNTTGPHYYSTSRFVWRTKENGHHDLVRIDVADLFNAPKKKEIKEEDFL